MGYALYHLYIIYNVMCLAKLSNKWMLCNILCQAKLKLMLNILWLDYLGFFLYFVLYYAYCIIYNRKIFMIFFLCCTVLHLYLHIFTILLYSIVNIGTYSYITYTISKYESTLIKIPHKCHTYLCNTMNVYNRLK